MDLVYFALLCSVLIFVHELGHFVFAKIFGVKVLTFSIGFGPKLVRIRGRETEYCVALLPLGGFVKMLEETRQDSVLPEDRPRTFEAQPIYKRAIIVLAGPAMNILFPVLLYFGVLLGEESSAPPTIGFVAPGHPADGKLFPGDRVLSVDEEPVYTFEELRAAIQKNPNREIALSVFRGRERVNVTIVPQEVRVEKPLEIVETIGEIGIGPSQPAAVIGVPRTDSPAYRAGLRTFDVVIEVRGRPIQRYSELEAALLENRGETVPVAYLRPVRVENAMGSMAEVSVYESGVAALTPDVGAASVSQRTGMESADLYVYDVPEGSAEYKAELRPGDRIIAVDNVEVPAWITFEERLFADRDKPHTITFERQGVRKSGTIQLRREVYVDEYGTERPRYLLRTRNWAPVVPEEPVESQRAVSNALVGALEETYDVARFILIGVVRISEGKVSLSTLGGPLTVYDVVGQESKKGASYFVWAMAVISINLGLINLLPIPVLDGGHLLFFLFEALLRRPLPLRVREIASLFGMVFLMAMMGIAFKNDLERRWDVIETQIRELTD
ncbi:MAG: RIP metalloprotease RseP [Polyangiaceae bacterium]|nr:RIP metalloprotease RseP [Polyangiaceae bacterium]